MDRPGALSRSLQQLRRVMQTFAAAGLPDAPSWCVALSGGPDSLALTTAAATVRPTTALIVDHGLQPGSDAVAAAARAQALQVGCVQAHVLRVTVDGAGGPEAAARTARYRALDAARDGAPVLLGHTLDDQAETVLLGLGRGSGPRSIAGMQVADPPWFRPLLHQRRSLTRAACADLGLQPWDDPHNHDRRFTRVRLRDEVLPLLDDVLAGGVAEALARTADAVREDCQALDTIADAELGQAISGADLRVDVLARLLPAVRLRVIRAWLLRGGASGLTATQIRAVDALVTGWRGQGGVAVGSGLAWTRLVAERRGEVLELRTRPVA